jgi:hypothetical protein
VDDATEGVGFDRVDLLGVVLFAHVPNGVGDHFAEPRPADLIVIEEAGKLVLGEGVVLVGIELAKAFGQFVCRHDVSLTKATTQLYWEIEPSHE